MIKKLLSDSGILLIAGVATKARALLLFPIISQNLSLAEYGVITFVGILFTISTVIFSAGSHQGLLRFFNKLESIGERQSLCASVFWANAVVGCLIVLLLLFGGDFIDAELVSFWGEGNGLFIFLAWILQFLQLQSVAILRARLLTRRVAWLSIASIVVFGCSVLYFVHVLQLGLKGYWIAMLFGNAVSSIASIWMVRDYLMGNFSFKLLRKVVRFSLPLGLSTLAAVGWMTSDRILVKIFLTPEDLGLIGVAFQLASAVGLFTNAIGQAIVPLIYSEEKNPKLGQKLSILLSLFSYAAVLITVALCLFSGFALQVLAPHEFQDAKNYVAPLAVVLLCECLIRFFPGLHFAGKTKLLFWIQVGTLAMNLVLSSLLIERFGLSGVTVASVLAAGVYSLLIIRKSLEYFATKMSYEVYMGWTLVFGISLLAPSGFFEYGVAWVFLLVVFFVALTLSLVCVKKLRAA